jgi:hypothetical protein
MRCMIKLIMGLHLRRILIYASQSIAAQKPTAKYIRFHDQIRALFISGTLTVEMSPITQGFISLKSCLITSGSQSSRGGFRSLSPQIL